MNTRTKKPAPAGDRVLASAELKGLLALATKGAERDGIPTYVLNALRDAIDELHPRPARQPQQKWEPTSEQIWKPGMKREDGKHLSAWTVYQAGFGHLDRADMPYAHQVRQHPKTREFYNALCVFVSRNKAKGASPSSIAELFPMANDVRPGIGLNAARLRQRKA